MSGELDENIIVLAVNLEDPNFNLPRYVCRILRGDTHKRHQKRRCCHARKHVRMGDAQVEALEHLLNEAMPMPGGFGGLETSRFICHREGEHEVAINDTYLSFLTVLPVSVLSNPRYDLINAYSLVACRTFLDNGNLPFDLNELEGELALLFPDEYAMTCAEEILSSGNFSLELNANRIPEATDPEPIAALQRNAAAPQDLKRLIPEPVVVVVYINGHPARALLDSGSLADFMSAKLAHQLGIKTFELVKPLPVQMAVQGSRTKVNLGCKAQIKYQNVSETRYFDIVNLLNYDLILGTPFLFQHKVALGLNPTTVVVGSDCALPIEGKSVRAIASRAAEIYEDKLEMARKLLREYAEPICRDASDAPLPPLRAVNHTIPLKDPNRVYSWRPSKCPDALRALWTEKRDAYLKS
ncbi:hypothetical protein K474DRAFT_1595981, partial [Panus rudis PR-1116 ss-1]